MGILTYCRYRRSYKFVTVSSVSCETGIVTAPIKTAYASLVGGDLIILAGYAWDGASGPTWDTRSTVLASLVHDTFYQFMRENQLPRSYRKQADQLFRQMLREGGMGRVRSSVWYRGLRIGGARSTRPRDDASELLTVP